MSDMQYTGNWAPRSSEEKVEDIEVVRVLWEGIGKIFLGEVEQAKRVRQETMLPNAVDVTETGAVPDYLVDGDSWYLTEEEARGAEIGNAINVMEKSDG